MQAQLGLLFRQLPQVGQLMESEEFVALQKTYSRDLVVVQVRSALSELRLQLGAGSLDEAALIQALQELPGAVRQTLRGAMRPSLRPVINATGVILQTNLGRAPLSEAAIEHIAAIARGYCNLELDLRTGERGHRDAHVESLILRVLEMRHRGGAEALKAKAAVVVNNCAAACFLTLNSLAEGGEVIVSRGELVEIGGGFRVPDILRKSGALLREVGTTNRTRIQDYAAAITPATRLILRVHRSNFRMEGFTSRPTLQELQELGEWSSIPVFEDQGTGCAVDLGATGLAMGAEDESYWPDSAASGSAVVACSGDKLLGGPQCGILVGEAQHIHRIRTNPLFRALRVDKLTYAALEITLMAYLNGAEDTLPTIAMMRRTPDEIRQRCVRLADDFSRDSVTAEVMETTSVVGGGTTPGASLPSFAVSLVAHEISEAVLAERLRHGELAVMGRVSEGRVLLDLRTVQPSQDVLLLGAVRTALRDRGEELR